MPRNKIKTVTVTMRIDPKLLQKQKQTLMDSFYPHDKRDIHMLVLIELIDVIQDHMEDNYGKPS